MVVPKKTARTLREKKVLLACVQHYIKTGKPVGSMTLQEEEFSDLSSATIRNYFAELELQGLLKQQHTSGGRIPTWSAFRLYADEWKGRVNAQPLVMFEEFSSLTNFQGKEVALLLQEALELFSSKVQTAAFLSSPRFDHDFIITIKPQMLDQKRLVCVLLTQFGIIRTELFVLDRKISHHELKRMENFFQALVTGEHDFLFEAEEEKRFFKTIYQELMVRHIAHSASFLQKDVLRTGLSRLITVPDPMDHASLSEAFQLFEDKDTLRSLSFEVCKQDTLCFWLGDDLEKLGQISSDLVIVAVPYYIHRKPVGLIGVLSAIRAPYYELFQTLKSLSEILSHTLTTALYKHRISYRADQKRSVLQDQEKRILVETGCILLEHKSL